MQLISVLPFGNVLQMAEIKGSVLREALEQGLSEYPEPSGGFPQVSGMSLTFDPASPPGSRITKLDVGGEPLDDDKTYTLATNDYLGTLGGDGYTMLRQVFNTRLLPLREPDLATLDEVLTWYLNEHADEVSYKTEGRIKPSG
jgi:2',3'-cyclic-nucleotide 2'-phosphodiesterase (5'-nucleotidase family)